MEEGMTTLVRILFVPLALVIAVLFALAVALRALRNRLDELDPMAEPWGDL